MSETKPKKKRYQSQSYYIIKMIAGGYIGYMAYQLIMEGVNRNTENVAVCYIFGALFGIFAIHLFVRNLIEYLKYTRTNRFEDEIYGTKSEEANLDPDAIAVHEKPEPVEKKSIGDIAKMGGSIGEDSEEEE